eukprot:3373408-Prymnesium_polylepis.2
MPCSRSQPARIAPLRRILRRRAGVQPGALRERVAQQQPAAHLVLFSANDSPAHPAVLTVARQRAAVARARVHPLRELDLAPLGRRGD